jgi:hypothetical protein
MRDLLSTIGVESRTGKDACSFSLSLALDVFLRREGRWMSLSLRGERGLIVHILMDFCRSSLLCMFGGTSKRVF